MKIIQLMRPKQYVKNTLVFAPWFFTFEFQWSELLSIFIAFVGFSLIASSIYILNDIKDIDEDRNHPKKKFRPLASKQIPIKIAWICFFSLSALTLLAALLIRKELFWVLLTYFILNIAYSFKLKHIAILDVCIIAFGFVLRLFAGSAFISQPLSMWIILLTFLLALFIALAKRRDDVLLSQLGNSTRKSIKGYNLEFINSAMTLMAGVIVVSYIQYVTDPGVISRIQSDHLYLTTLFVILGVLRYMQLTFVESKSGHPTYIFLNDLFLQLVMFLWVVSFPVLLYLRPLA